MLQKTNNFAETRHIEINVSNKIKGFKMMNNVRLSQC